ncbi:MAG: hypothetical protein K2O39_00190 [Clostridiales bacterium]|nr:hypothetical protein [Clostridiales bacterium]
MKNISHSPVTEMLSGRHKIWLIIGLTLLPIADLSACIVLWIFGAASSYWMLPFLMTVADLLYLLGVVLSNQRFKYAQKLFFVYIVVTIVFVIIWLAEFASDPVIFADTTLSAWGLLHAVGIAAVGISYLYASRRVRIGRRVQLVLAITFSAVALLGCVAFYGVAVIGDGYFGQGHGTLPLVYTYIGDDECEVTDVIYGNGDSVVIPYEFNGRKVTKVSANVFSYANIKSVTLNCDADVALCEDTASTTRSVNTNITIYADKKYVDTIKSKLYREKESGVYYTARHALGNNVRPMGLDKDEVYITFDYDFDSYLDAEEKIIPTWYGKKGDTFKLSDIKDVDYVTYSDVNSDDALYYCYYNVGHTVDSEGGGRIMSELKYANIAIDGATIDKSLNSVPVRFQKIYKVFAGESNDEMYDTDDYFPFGRVNGAWCDYKLTVASKADELLEPFDRGEAFTRTMQYRAFNSTTYREFTSLAELLREGYSVVTITPYWELVKPQITISRVNSVGETVQGGVIYGDDFELSVTVTHPLSGIQIGYEWYDGGGQQFEDENEQSLRQRASNVGIRTFSAVVKVSAPEITSCVSSRAENITVSILRRPITVKWKMEGGGDVYDGNPRQIVNTVENAAPDETVLLIGYNVSGAAGTYTERAEFASSSQAEKYSIVEGSSYTYTIKPCPVPLTWDEQTEFEYDAKMFHPTAHALDLSGNELVINYTGYGIDAGDYSTTATLFNTNYVIDDASQKTMEFKVTPKSVVVAWSFNSLIYNGDVQAPTAIAVGVGGENVALNIIGGQIHANVLNGSTTTVYTAVATSANKNYTVSSGSSSWDYTIEPYGVTIEWPDTTLTYNGQRQVPIAAAVGVKNQIVYATVSVAGFPTGVLNVGSYTAVAEITNTDYKVNGGSSHEFTVKPMEVSAEWGSTQLTYNGEFQMPTATAKGANGENLPLSVTGSVIRIGDGTANAKFTTEQSNYTLTNTTKAFSIQKKVLNIVINNVTVEYGQTPHYTYDITGVVDGEYVTVTCSISYRPDQNGNIPVGEYTINAALSITDSSSYSLNIVQSGKLTVTASV